MKQMYELSPPSKVFFHITSLYYQCYYCFKRVWVIPVFKTCNFQQLSFVYLGQLKDTILPMLSFPGVVSVNSYLPTYRLVFSFIFLVKYLGFMILGLYKLLKFKISIWCKNYRSRYLSDARNNASSPLSEVLNWTLNAGRW